MKKIIASFLLTATIFTASLSVETTQEEINGFDRISDEITIVVTNGEEDPPAN